jgi:hypothetical protein
MFKCEFCNAILKSMSSLNQHKKITKYCLKIQNKNNENKFICHYCENNFTTKQSLTNHLKICKEKDINIHIENEEKIIDLEGEIKLLNEEIRTLNDRINEQNIIISKLEAENNIYKKDHDSLNKIYSINNDTLLDIAKQTKNTYNTVNNLAVYDIDKITEHFTNKLEYMTKEDIINGQRGIANIIAPCLQDENGNKMLSCTDRSRLVFTKVDSNKNKIKDIELKELASVIKPLAIKKADEILIDHNKSREKAFRIDFLKDKIKDYNKYIEHFNNNISKEYNEKRKRDYMQKVEEYENNIIECNLEIESYNNDNIYGLTEDKEEENDKILDGHTDIKQLDTESSKFARQVCKLLT